MTQVSQDQPEPLSQALVQLRWLNEHSRIVHRGTTEGLRFASDAVVHELAHVRMFGASSLDDYFAYRETTTPSGAMVQYVNQLFDTHKPDGRRRDQDEAFALAIGAHILDGLGCLVDYDAYVERSVQVASTQADPGAVVHSVWAASQSIASREHAEALRSWLPLLYTYERQVNA